MKLHVSVALPHEDDQFIDQDITGFDDIDRIGARVASAARRWLRSVQVRKQVQRTSIVLTAQFNEREPRAAAEEKPRRRRKKSADNGSAG